MGTTNPEEPRMYYLRFSARISKNGDFSLKNKLCHIGQKNVKVKGLSKTIFENPPALGSLFSTPDTSKDVEDVKGSTSVVSQTDAEIINNWFIEKCNVTFTATRSAAFTNTAKFTKVPSSDEGIGPDSITFGPNAGTQSFILAKREVYVLNVSNLDGSGRPSGHNIYSYVRNRTQMQLEDISSSPDNWSIADLGITISGLCGGGWYVQGNLTYFSGSYTGSTYGKGTSRAHNRPPPPPPAPVYPPRRPVDHRSEPSGGNDNYSPQPLYSYSVGNTYYNSYSMSRANKAANRVARTRPWGPSAPKNVRDNRGGGGGSSSGGGGCFLTTAVVEMRGEADDGTILNTLRMYRDNFLLEHYPNEIEEYYNIAPKIVSAIPKTHSVWNWIGEQIDLSISYINRHENEKAYLTYKNMVRVLEKNWLKDL